MGKVMNLLYKILFQRGGGQSDVWMGNEAETVKRGRGKSRDLS